ncbi:MotA/TolQ/ExbB proton channel family protein [Telmatocola sphagniphila]|uniref:MotA/TolQ/ExbB proton channel family protein n=1 Tax=Telmatocola sphagniphila TaxID=1123043 RepID=A0A8E6B7U2_9BACT|nr:MotA/TolQ/ExbB proton channel family protein [Telmatocola sphagniphila]QVL32859.1 MotA/TolQ/ExbB proton channel family protein [Telmatocola sphagniphila]
MNALTHFLFEEWYFSAPMLLMSFIAITLVIWRMMLNASSKTDMNAFLPAFQDKMAKEGPEAALEFCRTQHGFIPQKLYVAGLEAAPQGLSAMRRSMAHVMEFEIIPDLNFLLAPILAIAKIATMVGLLGTVISMINTFNAISASKNNPTEVTSQAGAIGLALFATALGLMTAIPLVFTHVMFKDNVSRFEIKMRSAAQKLLVIYQGIKSSSEKRKKRESA